MALTAQQQDLIGQNFRTLKDGGVAFPKREPGRLTAKAFLKGYVSAAQNPPAGVAYSQDVVDAASDLDTLADLLP
jgi:hypothetical protein